MVPINVLKSRIMLKANSRAPKLLSNAERKYATARFHGDFEYLIYRKPQDMLCFGSNLDRKTFPLNKNQMNGFMKRIFKEVNAKIGPGCYETAKINSLDDALRKPSSKLGTIGKEERFPEVRVYNPAIEENVLHLKTGGKKKPPFSSSTKRKIQVFEGNDYPAPNRYNQRHKKYDIPFMYSFNGKKTLKPAVEIKCVPINMDLCEICAKSCGDQGDYWRYQDKIFICRRDYDNLWNEGIKTVSMFSLKDFTPVRDCSFVHQHDGLKSALKIMNTKEFLKKIRTETYLSVYFPIGKETSK